MHGADTTLRHSRQIHIMQRHSFTFYTLLDYVLVLKRDEVKLRCSDRYRDIVETPLLCVGSVRALSVIFLDALGRTRRG